MKCDQATTWLLMSAGPSELPEPVARHLETCDSCRQLKRRLLQFNEQLSGFLPHAECQASRQRFLDGIDKLPARGALAVVSASTSTRRWAQNDKSFWVGKRLAALAAALVIAFVGGWIVSGRYQSGRPLAENAFQQPHAGAPSPSEPSQIVVQKTEPSRTFGRWPVSAAAGIDLGILRPLIDNHLRVAAAEEPAERFMLVVQLADVLWKEVVREVETGAIANFPHVSRLYTHVVASTLPSGSQSLDVDDQPTRERIAAVLQRRQSEARRLADGRAPAVSDLLLRMGRQSELAAEWITTGDVPGHAETSAPPLDAANDLLTTVVAATTQLASERDPLRRAEQSCEVADQLANTIVFTSFGEGTEDSEELGIFLGDVLEHGVMVNLSRFEPTGADDPRLAEYERIKQRGHRAGEALQRNLERTPAPARKGLLRAIEAQRQGREKGPPQMHGSQERPTHPGRRDGFVPPGLRK